MFSIKTRHEPVSHHNGKIARKETSKLFLCEYFTTQFHRNVNFDEIDTKQSTGKSDGF